MNVARCERLERKPLTGFWFRAIPPRYWLTSLDTAQTVKSRSRFSAGPDADPPFEILYLCENGALALEEVGAHFKHPTTGRIFAAPIPTLIINVEVTLQQVADLTDLSQQQLLKTNAQELTGDWRANWYRQANSPVPSPTGAAPTQELGQAVFASRNLEAFLVMSSKMPDHKNLVVFPQKLNTGSRLKFTNPVTNEEHVIQALPKVGRRSKPR